MIDFPLLRAMFGEFTTSHRFARVPEASLVMDTPEAVAAFARAGGHNGVLSGVYAFQLAQMCAMIRAGDRVLDLGCGPANLLVSAAQLHPDARFTGVDLSPGMIARGNALVAAKGLKNVSLAIDDICKLETVGDGSVDVVLSSMALHHLPDVGSLRHCLATLGRVLSPQGQVYLCDFGRLKTLRAVEYFVRRAIPVNEPVLAHDYHESLKAAFSKAEFQAALPAALAQRVRIHSTFGSPVMVVLKTDHQAPLPAAVRESVLGMISHLPREKRQDFQQLRFFFRLGGVKCTI